MPARKSSAWAGTRPLYGFDFLDVDGVVGGVQSADDLDVLALILLGGLDVVQIVRAVRGLIFERVAAVALGDFSGERFGFLALALARGWGLRLRLQRYSGMRVVSGAPGDSGCGQGQQRY